MVIADLGGEETEIPQGPVFPNPALSLESFVVGAVSEL